VSIESTARRGLTPADAASARARRVDFDVIVIGAGVIGLSVAWRAAQRGLSVVVLDRGQPGCGTSSVAAGMIAPISEADGADLALLQLGVRSAALWPEFAAELEDASGHTVAYRKSGTLLVARDRDEAEALDREQALRARLGLSTERLSASAARRREPALAPRVRLALEIADDHSVDPSAVVRALVAAVRNAGVVLLPGAEVTEVTVERDTARGVVLACGHQIASGEVVIAAGPWSAALGGVPDHARVPVRPLKGQLLRLCDPDRGQVLDRVVRWGLPRPGYLVPRVDGRIVLGATMEDRGFDTSITGLGVYELLHDAIDLVPAIGELVVEGLVAGLRPATPDNAPVIGAGAIRGLLYATGHYRHGVLLAPITADLVAQELVGAVPAHAFSIERFDAMVAA
jgi:glycine oxidase